MSNTPKEQLRTDLPVSVRLSNGMALLSNLRAWDPALDIALILALKIVPAREE